MGKPKSKFRSIVTDNPKYCLDIHSGSSESNVPLISYQCHKGSNQQFSYNKKTKQIKSKSSKKCLDMNGMYVVQNKCNSRKKLKNGNIRTNNYVL